MTIALVSYNVENNLFVQFPAHNDHRHMTHITGIQPKKQIIIIMRTDIDPQKLSFY